MENKLELWIQEHGASETDAMNDLQNFGIVSDNCVWAKDVADADCDKAIGFLESTR